MVKYLLNIYVFLILFMNSLIICSNPHITHIPKFLILYKVSKPLVLVLGGDSTPIVTPRLVSPLLAITC